MTEARGVLGQHLLRAARAGHRHVRGHQDGREDGRQARSPVGRNRRHRDDYQDKPSFTLGSAEVSPLSMAEAYATFAARGIHCDPIIVVQDHHPGRQEPRAAGRQLQAGDGQGRRRRGQQGAARPSSTRAPARGRKIHDGRDQAGKTGTIDSNEAVWFAGYTPRDRRRRDDLDRQHEEAVHQVGEGQAGGQFRRSGVKGYRVPSTDVYLEGSGSGDAGTKIWKPVMADVPQADAQDQLRPAAAPDPGRQAGTVPYVDGLSIAAATKKLREGRLQRRRRSTSTAPVEVQLHRLVPGPGSRRSSARSTHVSKGKDPPSQGREEGRQPRRSGDKKKKDKRRRLSHPNARRGRSPLGDRPRRRPESRPLRERRRVSRASWRRTSAATAPPSARPLVCGVTTPITLPMPLHAELGRHRSGDRVARRPRRSPRPSAAAADSRPARPPPRCSFSASSGRPAAV